MAFTVTPTSGAAPYNFLVTFENAELIDGDKYTLLFFSTTGSGTCPSAGNNPIEGGAIESFLETGTFITSNNVPAGSCRAYTLSIRDNVDQSVISTMTVTVDNV